MCVWKKRKSVTDTGAFKTTMKRKLWVVTRRSFLSPEGRIKKSKVARFWRKQVPRKF